VLRYLGSMLIVAMALVLTCALAAILGADLVQRMSAVGWRLTVFDAVGAVGRQPPVLAAALEDADSGKPAPRVRLALRLENDWTGWMTTNSAGLAGVRQVAGLPAGMYGFRAGLSELHPRLDVWSAGTVWIWPADAPVVWIDSSALVPVGGKAEDLPRRALLPAAAVAADALKVLATGRRPVYLVASQAAEYGPVRRRIKALGLPLGPAFWIMPGREAKYLNDLAQTWPRVDAAAVCSPELLKAARQAKAPVRQVPSAGDSGAAAQRAWREVSDPMSMPSGGGRIPGR